MKQIKLFMADDHAMFRGAMRTCLEQQEDIQIVGEAGTGEATLDQIAGTSPDILLLDISLPDITGTVVAKRALKIMPDLLIIVLTMHQEEYYAQDMIRIGVKGYVLKGSTGEELLQAIHDVMNGGTYWDKAVIEDAMSFFAGKQTDKGSHAEVESLTKREKEVCRLLALGHTNAEIGKDLGISIRTVQTHRQNITSKLQLKTRAELVAFAIQSGIFTPS